MYAVPKPGSDAAKRYAFLKDELEKVQQMQQAMNEVAPPPSAVSVAMASMADFLQCPTVAKLSARLELLFSQTQRVLGGFSPRVHRDFKERGHDASRSWSGLRDALQEARRQRLAQVSPAERIRAEEEEEHIVNIVELDDIHGDDCPAGGSRLMTDGNGMISRDLMEKVRSEMDWGDTPSHVQLRLWIVGGHFQDGGRLRLTTAGAFSAQVRRISGQGCPRLLEFVARKDHRAA
jgi:hypothetical protein